jgi:hypothetical protein
MLNTIIENLATVISVLAAVIALLSAVYARWQVNAANHANEIALHKDRVNVYNGLRSFTTHISSTGVDITCDEIWKFLEVVDSGEFYFSEKIASRLNAIFVNSHKLLGLNEEWKVIEKEHGRGEAKKYNEPRNALMIAIRDECDSTQKEIKSYLRIGRTRLIKSY